MFYICVVVSNGNGFGQRRPTLSVTIKRILERYPDGQIFKVEKTAQLHRYIATPNSTAWGSILCVKYLDVVELSKSSATNSAN